MINEIKEELKNLRGAKVTQFGQPITLADSIDETEIDILEVLDVLAPYEIIEGVDFDNFDDLCASYCDGGNTYNDGAPIRNHINWEKFVAFDGSFVYRVMIQRGYGDVRCNYTDYFYLRFEEADDFFYTLFDNLETYRTIEVDGEWYDYDLSLFSDSFDVWCEGEFVCTAYGDKDDIAECIREALTK